jgi:hypothetical protein
MYIKMKGNLTIKLLVGLLVLSAIYGVIKLTSGSSRSKSFREVLVDIDTAKVTRIEIESGGAKTILKKESEGWIVGENGKRATSSSVKGLLTNLQTIEPSRLASRKEEAWSEFQVDTAGTRVKVYQGGDAALDLVIGKFGVEGQRAYFSYVRLSEDKDTYVANNFMSMGIGKSDADYRNGQILKLKKDSINSVDFKNPEGTFTLEKQANNQWVIGGVPADSASVTEFLNGLTFVSSKNFADADITNSSQQVIVHLASSADVTLESDGASLIRSSQNEMEIFQDQQVYEKLFKSPTDFVKQ